ncbi:hypothetical protein AAGS61_02485 [Lysinibacillus sp. KU-BSD001]
MGGFIIAIVSIIVGGAIPLSAIYLNHKKSTMKLQLQLAEKEIKLEELRLQTIAEETQKMRLELEQSKQTLLESTKQIDYTKP